MGGQHEKRNRPRRSRRSPEQLVRDLETKLDELRLQAHKTRSFSPDQVRAEIARLGLTVEEYARLMEVSQATVNRWMKRKTRPRARNLGRWFALQGITREEVKSALGF